jgi:hypothetical protein
VNFPPSLLSGSEIVFGRHGKPAYIIYTFFSLVTNLINGSALVAGGCADFAALTRNEYLGSLLDSPYHRHNIHRCRRSSSNIHLRLQYLHTIFLHICIFAFMFQIYCINPNIGSPAEIWRLRKATETSSPANSYMTVVYKLKFLLNS